MRGRRSSVWLLPLLATIVAVGCATLSPLPVPIRAVGAAPLVLFLPGYWLLAAIAPDLPREPLERAVFSVGISLALCVLVGLVLNLTPGGLTGDAWVLALGGLALIESAAASLRGRRRDAAHVPAALPTPSRRAGAIFVLAGLVLIGAFALIRLTAEEQAAPSFTQFWITPPGTTGGMVQLGVRNLEPTTMTYVVELRANGDLVQRWPSITLSTRQSWQTDAAAPDGTPLRGPLEALLFRADDPGQVYRRVLLRGD